MKYPLMMAADDGADGAPGGTEAPVDRGDNLLDAALAALEPGDDKAAAPAEGDEAPKGDDRPRDEKGRFLKADGTVDEEPAKEEVDEAPKGKKGPIMVPKARLDEETRRRAELEARLKEAEGRNQAATADELAKTVQENIDKMESQYADFIADGKKEDAARLRREIRAEEHKLFTMTSTAISGKAQQAAVEQVRVDMMVSQLEQAYPTLNPEHEEYSQDVVDEVLFLKASFEKNGLRPSEALAAAAKYAFRAAEAPAPEPAKPGLKKGAKEADRKEAATKKALEASDKQPAKTDEIGLDHDKAGGGVTAKAVEKMSEEEFNALPASVKARLRGDVYETAA